MELKETKPIIFIISGKARHGKDTSADFIKQYYVSKNKSLINLQFSSYIKEYAKKISGWDGSEETKPRQLLQTLGTSVIREKIDEEFFIKRIISDIKVYSFFFDVITISDARAKKEIDLLKKEFKNVIAINIFRTNFDNKLSLEQKMHFTEIDLDDYNKFDYKIMNDGSLLDLQNKINKLLEENEGKYEKIK